MSSGGEHTWQRCPECEGSGSIETTIPETCPECEGSGSIETTISETCPECGGIGYNDNDEVCSTCGGSGNIEATMSDPCPTCSGTGSIETTSTKTCPTCGGTGEIISGSGGSGGNETTRQGEFLSGIPLSSLKKAKFLTKVGGFLTIVKLIYRNVVYDISKTSQTGAVLYSGGYDGFVFIAPDDRLDFAAIPSMTMYELMDYLYTNTSETRIPAWDDFFEWFNEVSDQVRQVLASAYRAYLISPNSNHYFQIGIPSLGTVSDFPSFTSAFKTALEEGVADETGTLPKDIAAEEFQVADKAFAFGASITSLDEEGNEKVMLGLMFLFRE